MTALIEFSHNMTPVTMAACHLIGSGERNRPLIRADEFGTSLSGALITDVGIPKRQLVRFVFERDYPRAARGVRHVARHRRAYTAGVLAAGVLAAAAGLRAVR